MTDNSFYRAFRITWFRIERFILRSATNDRLFVLSFDSAQEDIV